MLSPLMHPAHKSQWSKSKLKSKLVQDYRTKASKNALAQLFANDGVPDDALCLSIGGGPSRAHSRLTNLNIAPFPNVDVVGGSKRQ